MQQGKFVDAFCKSIGERHDDRENHRRSTHHSRPDEHGLGCCLEGIARAVVFFEQILGAFEIRVEVKVLPQFFLDVWNLLDQGEFVDRLGVVRDRAVGIDGDRYGTHAQKAKRHEAECENGGGDH